VGGKVGISVRRIAVKAATVIFDSNAVVTQALLERERPADGDGGPLTVRAAHDLHVAVFVAHGAVAREVAARVLREVRLAVAVVVAEDLRVDRERVGSL
jgi:hypothetical protein